MRKLLPSVVTEWSQYGRWWCPVSLDTHCPFCGRMVNLGLNRHKHDEIRNVILASARCSGCGKDTWIFVVDPKQAGSEGSREAAYLAIYPPTETTHRPIEGSDLLPEGLRQAYYEAIEVYNAKVWPGAVTLSRRALEALVMNLIGVETFDGKSLAKMLEELPGKVELGKPITALATQVRKGGNLGAHFDVKSKPDQQLAKTILDLLEYLLEYFYTIPRLIEQAEQVLDKHD